jgi:hypothetical protein
MYDGRRNSRKIMITSLSMAKANLSRKHKYDDNIKIPNDMRHEDVNYPEWNIMSLL